MILLSSIKSGSNIEFPIAINKSSIPTFLTTDVNLNIAPIWLANDLASDSDTFSSSNKSHLLPAIAIIIFFFFFSFNWLYQ